MWGIVQQIGGVTMRRGPFARQIRAVERGALGGIDYGLYLVAFFLFMALVLVAARKVGLW
jgi:hypothetical protein